MSNVAKIIPLPNAPANDNTETLGLILAELRTLRSVVEVQGQELLELRRGLAVPPSVSMPVEDAARVLGCGKTQVFALLRNGTLKRGKSVGRRTMVTRASVDELQGARRASTPQRPARRTGVRVMSARGVSAAVRSLAV